MNILSPFNFPLDVILMLWFLWYSATNQPMGLLLKTTFLSKGLPPTMTLDLNAGRLCLFGHISDTTLWFLSRMWINRIQN